MAAAERVINHIRIVDIPPGDVPFPIKKEWIGMSLPLANSFFRTAEQNFDYIVNAGDAIQRLSEKGTEGGHQAAQYWQGELTKKHGDYRRAQLVFSSSACEFTGDRDQD